MTISFFEGVVSGSSRGSGSGRLAYRIYFRRLEPGGGPFRNGPDFCIRFVSAARFRGGGIFLFSLPAVLSLRR